MKKRSDPTLNTLLQLAENLRDQEVDDTGLFGPGSIPPGMEEAVFTILRAVAKRPRTAIPTAAAPPADGSNTESGLPN